VYEWEGMRLPVYLGPCTYEPAEDTWLALKALRRAFRLFSPGSVADLGTGTGVLALAASLMGADRIVATDASRWAVESAARTLGGRGSVLYCDWAECLHDGSVDIAVANTPYLPVEDLLGDPCGRDLARAWSGAPESVARACREAVRVASRGIVIVYSSLSGFDLEECIRGTGFGVLARFEEAFFMEKIIGVLAGVPGKGG